MRTSLSKWGNSLAFRVPKEMAEAAGFQEGAALELTLEDGAIVVRKKLYDIKELVEDMKGKELHPLIFDDPPRGSEIW